MRHKLMMLMVVGLVSTSLYGANYSQNTPRLTATVKTNTNNSQATRQQVKNTVAPSVASEPQTVIAAFIKAWNGHDPKAMAALWVEDGDLLDPWGKMSSGKRLVEKAFATDQTGRFKSSSISLSIDSVRFLGDVAIVDTTGRITNVKGADGSPEPNLDHHVVWVMQRQGGNWRIVSARPYTLIAKPAAGSRDNNR